MREIEKRVQEKRSMEATRKKLMGFTGKLGCIARNLGQPIIAHTQGGMYHNVYDIDDPYAIPENDDPLELKDGYAKDIMDQIPVYITGEQVDEPFGPEWSERQEQLSVNQYGVGWYFDGLSRGIHLEIKFDDSQKILTASYQGYEVYREVAGELMAYAPSPAWENKIDELYAVAKKLDKARKKTDRAEEIAEAKLLKDSWWQSVRKRWGV